MLEFALTLPILLLVTMGIFDFGRALFTYAEASNALRNGLRYGAILGYSEGTPQYANCRGMIDIARHVSFATKDISVRVSYINKDENGDEVVNHSDAIVDGGVTLTCYFQGGNYIFGAEASPTTEDALKSKVISKTSNGDILLISTNANVSMVTPVFPQYMPVVINGQRTLIKDIELFRCGDGLWAPTETCWNCALDMGEPPEDVGSPPQDATPPNCLLIVPSGSGPYDFDIEWANVSSETSYSYQYYLDGSATAAGSGTTGVNISTLDLTGISCTTFRFRVQAIRVVGTTTTYSEWVDETVDCASGSGGGGVSIDVSVDDSAPYMVSTSSSSDTNLEVVFEDNANDDTGFEIACATGATEPAWPGSYDLTCGGGVNPLAGNGATVGNVTWIASDYMTGLTCGTTYWFRARAFNPGHPHGTDYSQWSSNAISGQLTCLDQPVISNVVGDNNERTISWGAITGATTYTIQRSWSTSGPWDPVLPTTTTAATSITDNYDLDENDCGDATFFYRVQAGDGVSTSFWSDPFTFPRPAPCINSVPDAPSGLTVGTITTTTIDLTWTDNSSAADAAGNETGFRIFIYNSAGTALVNTVTVGADLTSATVTGLTCNTTYQFRVVAYNTYGNSAQAVTSPATRTMSACPTVVTGLCLISGGTRFPALSWTSKSGASSYEVLARRYDQATYTVVRSSALNSDGLSCGNKSATHSDSCFKSNSTYYPGTDSDRKFYYIVRTYWTSGGYSDSVPVYIDSSTTGACS